MGPAWATAQSKESVVIRAQTWFRSLRLVTDGTSEGAGTNSVTVCPCI